MVILVALLAIDFYQMREIKQLNEEIALIKSGKSTTKNEYFEDTFNYLAIGNSITMHEVCDYWWNRSGLGSTTPDQDYYHQIVHHLDVYRGEVTSYPCNFNVWENMGHDRAETLELLDSYLDEKLNLVTIQLGENVKDMDTFESDFEELLTYVKEKAPNAQIIVVGDFWKYLNRNHIKQSVTEKMKMDFVSLDEICDNKQYQCGKGTVVIGADGTEHTVEHSGVAKHPNDAGMKYIADNIIPIIK